METITAQAGGSLLASMIGDMSLAQEHAECPVCFDELHSAPCAVFHAGGKRVCRHFLHEACARSLPTQHCPMCRAPWMEVVGVPSLSVDPEGWFRCVDVEGDGKLSKEQVSDVLLTQFPLDVAKFEAAMEKLWKRWDSDGSGYITQDEFYLPSTGLLAFVRAELLREPQQAARVPDIERERNQWFDYFDEEGRGSLSKESVVRGLIKTYNLAYDLAQVSQMRALVEAIWAVFDTDGTGRVTRDEFLKPGDGLADAIIASRPS